MKEKTIKTKSLVGIVALLLALMARPVSADIFSLDVTVDGQAASSGDSVTPGQSVSLALSTTGEVTGGMLETNVNVSAGDSASGSFDDTGWLVSGGSVTAAGSGFDVFFNGAVFMPRAAGNVWSVEFTVPDSAGTTIVIDANSGFWNSVNATAGNGDSGLPYVELNIDGGGAATTFDLTVEVTVGQGSVAPDGGTYEEGALVTLEATADSGYQFVGWFDESDSLLSTEDTLEVVMDATRTVSAEFEAISVPTELFIMDIAGATATENSGD